MAMVVTGYKAWAAEQVAAVSPRKIQYFEMTCTGANTDTAYDLATTAGTFWTATGGSTAGAAAKKLLYKIGALASYFNDYHGVLKITYIRAAAASGTAFTMAEGTATGIPDIAFASGSAPTSWRLVLSWVMPSEIQPVETSG